MSGQSIMDRVVAARHSIAGQGLAKSVCKATTEEIMGPKKKHLDYLLQCTNEPNVSIPQLADLLIERAQHSNWVVVFKSLITVHNLMNYGNERFTQYLASNNCTFNLSSFMDTSGVQRTGGIRGYDMSTFIRRYAKYLNDKAYSYRQMAFDFCKVKRGKDDGLLRTMNTEKLLKTLPVLQQQLDSLLEYDCTPNELTNGVINACFMLMFKDLIRLFACYNDGIINLLEKYFDMQKKQCRDALDLYKKFLIRMEKVSEFLKVAENVGIDKGDIPDLAKAPSSLLEALDQHLASIEGKKGQTVTTPTSKPPGFATAVNSISSNSTVKVSDEDKRKIIEEENRQLEQLKEQRLKEIASSPATSPDGVPALASTNPFADGTPSSQPSASNPLAADLFGSPTQPNPHNMSSTTTTGSASDDLLKMAGNPFQQQIQNMMTTSNASQNGPSSAFGATPWGAPAQPVGSTTDSSSSGFASDVNFAAAFNTPSTASSFDAFGDILQPMVKDNANEPKKEPSLVPGDLDSSLASLAGNLSIHGANQIKTDHQWQPKSEVRRTGGTTFSNQPTVATGMTGMPAGWTGQPNVQPQPQPQQYQQQPGAYVYGYYMMAPRVAYPMGMSAVPGGMAPAPQYNMGMGMNRPMAPMGGVAPMAGGYGQPVMNQPRPTAAATVQPNDPFGAL